MTWCCWVLALLLVLTAAIGAGVLMGRVMRGGRTLR